MDTLSIRQKLILLSLPLAFLLIVGYSSFSQRKRTEKPEAEIPSTSSISRHKSKSAVLKELYEGFFGSTKKLAEKLSSSDQETVTGALFFLELREDPAGKEQARPLLESDNHYIWHCAAHYLAAIGDSDTVPWLIKSLRHPARMSVPDSLVYLSHFTKEDFGWDQGRWIDWWRERNPDSEFSFRYPRLEKEALRLSSRYCTEINSVYDAVTINRCGPGIRLIGIKSKAGLYDPKALTLLRTAVVGQWVHLRFDKGEKLDSKGSRRAFVYWARQGGNSSDLRAGLDAVPFKKLDSDDPIEVPYDRKPLINRYLLKSGLYEVDLSSVVDPALRRLLTSEATEK